MGLLLALAGLWALAGGGARRALSGPPLDRVDDASRARLDALLRKADEPAEAR
jgi:hypothetical protein